MQFATTVGHGPFKPAIKMNDCTYVLDKTFDSEDDAARAANELCCLIDDKAFEMLLAANFKPQLI